MEDRYSRQIAFYRIGESGQELITRAKIAIVGMGAIGSAVANMLARAGVGYLRLIDFDRVELSNLQRQTLYDEADAAEGRFKVEAAARRLQAINSRVTCEPVKLRITESNAIELLRGSDLVVDAVDCFDTRYHTCAAALRLGIPWIYGGVAGSEGVSMSVIPGRTPCFSCVFPHRPDKNEVETAATAGILSSIVNVIASVQVTEALKIILGQLDLVRPGLLKIDLWRWDVRVFKVARRSDCEMCRLASAKMPH